MNDILKPTNKKFKIKQFEDKFKEDMVKRWLEQFDSMWEVKKLDERLTALNELKQQQKLKGHNEKAW